jgi:hypothetical protein
MHFGHRQTRAEQNQFKHPPRRKYHASLPSYENRGGCPQCKDYLEYYGTVMLVDTSIGLWLMLANWLTPSKEFPLLFSAQSVNPLQI